MNNGVASAVGPLPQVTAFPAVNTFTIAGSRMPGKWTLTSADKQFGWQIQQGYGLSGAVVFPKGDELVIPKFKGEFWAQADCLIFKQIRSTLLVKPAITPGGFLSVAALGIDHPELKALGVVSVVVGKVTPLIDEGAGLWTCTIDFLQYRAPQKAPPIPTLVIPDTTPQPVVAAQNAADVELQNALATFAAKRGTP